MKTTLLQASCLFMLAASVISKTEAQNWIPVGPSKGEINTYAVSGDTLFVIAKSGLFYSTNGGRNFTPKPSDLPPGDYLNMYAEGGVLLATEWYKGVYRSADGGTSWSLVLPGRYHDIFYSGSKPFRKSGKALFITNLTTQDTLYFTEDLGLTWSKTAIPYYHGGSVRAYKDTLFCYSYSGLLGSRVCLYRSGDRGKTWTVCGNGIPDADPVMHLEAYGDTLYVFGLQVYRSLDGGWNWTRHSSDTFRQTGSSNVYRPSLIGRTGRAVYGTGLGNANNAFVRWTPESPTWTNAGNGLPALGSSFNFIPLDKRILLSRSNGLFERSEGENAWRAIEPLGIPGPIPYSFSTNGVRSWAAAKPFVMQGTENQSDWSFYNPPALNDNYRIAFILETDSGLIVGDDNEAGTIQIRLSRNNGQTFRKVGEYYLDPSVRPMVFQHNKDSFFVLGSQGGIPSLAITDAALRVRSGFSTGLTAWTTADRAAGAVFFKNDFYVLSTGVHSGTSILKKKTPTSWLNHLGALDGKRFGSNALTVWNGRMYLAINKEGVRYTEDGNTWFRRSAGMEGATPNCFISRGDSLFAGTDRGVFLLKTGDTSWQNLTGNLASRDVTTLALTPATLWAHTRNGAVWRTALGGFSIPLDAWTRASALSGLWLYPNPVSGPLHIGSHWMGPGVVRIIDFQGRTLAVHQLSDVRRALISTQSLPGGIYTCLLEQNGQQLSARFMRL